MLTYNRTMHVQTFARGDPFMSLRGRIEELSKRHRQLDEQIAEEQKRPAADMSTIKDLKRQKLRIKEEIGYLQTG